MAKSKRRAAQAKASAPAPATKPAASAKGAPAPKAPAPVLDPAKIRERAHLLWTQGGMRPGQDLDNWLEAERQLRAEAR